MHHRYTVFMLLRASPHWMGLDASQRLACRDELLAWVFNHHPEVTLRYYDTEAFHGRYTAVAVWETTELPAYHAMVEALRGHDFFAKPWFELGDTIVGAEDGWREPETVPLWAGVA
jgi:hypothetical protein